MLIDWSSSMSLESAGIQAIVRAAPDMLIAAYRSNYMQDKGYLIIVAKGGRTADVSSVERAMPDLGGGNVVDGPALAWLIQQQQPRSWISDGCVTGESDVLSRVLAKEAHEIAEHGTVRRYETIESFNANEPSPELIPLHILGY